LCNGLRWDAAVKHLLPGVIIYGHRHLAMRAKGANKALRHEPSDRSRKRIGINIEIEHPAHGDGCRVGVQCG